MDRDVPCGIGGALLDTADARRAELVSMWTAPVHRRQGVGSLLVHAVMEWMRSRGVNALVLMVTSTNQPAIRFYTRLGFAMTGRNEPYPNDPTISELEMIRSI
jgi:ribosomal protein S18 acetylase RimI-like enzyme